MRRSEKLLVRTLPEKPFNLRMHKQLRKADNPVDILLSLLSFADDTIMVSRGADSVALDEPLTQTLQDWGETVKPSKTNRLLVGRRQNGLTTCLLQQCVFLVVGWNQWVAIRSMMTNGCWRLVLSGDLSVNSFLAMACRSE